MVAYSGTSNGMQSNVSLRLVQVIPSNQPTSKSGITIGTPSYFPKANYKKSSNITDVSKGLNPTMNTNTDITHNGTSDTNVNHLNIQMAPALFLSILLNKCVALDKYKWLLRRLFIRNKEIEKLSVLGIDEDAKDKSGRTYVTLEMRAHRCILASFSPYFESMFSHKFMEAVDGKIYIGNTLENKEDK
eukprot:123526_1